VVGAVVEVEVEVVGEEVVGEEVVGGGGGGKPEPGGQQIERRTRHERCFGCVERQRRHER
jgi:hypothetical protein